MDRDRRSRAQHIPERARPDARVSGLQVHHVLGTHLRVDAGEISRSLSTDRKARETRAMGNHWRHVGRAGPEHAGRGVSGPPDSGGQALLSEDFWRGCEDRLESRFVRIQLSTAADLQKVRHGLFRDPETALGARIHHFPLQAVLVAGAGWKQTPHVFST